MKKVKLKKRRFKWRLLVYMFFVFLGFQVSYNIIMNVKLASTNDEFIKCLLVDSNYHMLYEKKANNLFNRLFSYFFDINKPVKILENTFHYKANKVDSLGYVNNPVSEVSKKEEKALVYIYNTHQAEAYQGKALENYNITPGVMMASYIFQDRLKKEGIETLVLEDNLIDYMNLNNMKHSQSYKASRYFISNIIKDNPSLKLIIDLHRDSIPKEKSTVSINNKFCAKIVFVVGSEYDSYEDNLGVANKLNEMVNEKYPELTRGVLVKGGAGNNGVYNQDLSGKMILLEVGSDSNTIDEVLNTIELLSPIVKEFVNES
ncbi:MAG: stage II sporulation protein P [Bacilli bacterium]|nr:stage II sporulation protein P [Bacilli bacterium]